MRPALFLDTGYVLALEISSDTNHAAASQHWRSLTADLSPLVTTSYVFDEIVTFFNSRGLHAKAVQVGDNLLSSAFVELISVDEALFAEGWAYFQQHQDKRYSLTDCLSFVVMRKRAISTALAFDKHFVQAGFVKQP